MSETLPLQPAAPLTEEPLPPEKNVSPRWSLVTKLIVGMVLSAVALFLVVRFQVYLGMILTAFLLAFLFHPIARLLNNRLKLGWRLSITIVYIIMALVLGGLLAWLGISLFGQIQNLIKFIQENLGNLRVLLGEWSGQVFMLGPFEITIPELTTRYLSDLLVERIQPLLGQAGTLVGKVLSGGANFVFRFFIIYLVSFFVASETEGATAKLFSINLRGYEQDMKRMGIEVSNVWNAFIRGEFVVVGTAIVVFSIILGALGMPYFMGLALIAGLGRFVPYVGAWVSWLTFGLVAVFQNPAPFGLNPFVYMAIVLAFSLLVDSILDNLLTPKVMGNALRVHPAAVLLSALIGSQLLGLIGVILAAPVYATVKLVVTYILRKLMDQDPWESITYYQPPKQPMLYKWLRRFWEKASGWVRDKRAKAKA